MNKSRRWIILLMLSIMYGISQKNVLGYAMFLIFLLFNIYCIAKKRQQLIAYVELLMVSAIVPSNYVIILISVLSILYIKNGRQKLGNSLLYLMAAALLFIFNIIINAVKPINWIFYLIYTIPFFSLLIFFKKVSFSENEKAQIVEDIYFIVASQALSIFAFAATHWGLVSSMQDMDWVTGTFGPYQSSVLMFVCICLSVILLYNYSISKNKKSLYYAIGGILIALSTTSVTYTLVLIVSIGICILSYSKMKFKNKCLIACIALIGIIGFLCVSPDWIVKELPRLFDRNYLYNRVPKINVYRDVFFELPNRFGIINSFCGVGVGQYSSRAALTCTGLYIDSYTKLFPVSISDFTQIFIVPYNFDNQGLAGNSMSTIVSIQGEFGYFGLMLMLACIIRLIRKSKTFYSLLIAIFFIGTMIVDNSFEYSKYALFFWMCYYFCFAENSSVNTHGTIKNDTIVI